MRTRVPQTSPVVAAMVLAAAAALTLLAQLPAAFNSLDGAAKAAAGRNELGGALATADAVGLNDDFVRVAFQAIPSDARFAVVLPPDPSKAATKYGVNPITFDAAPPFFEDDLLPRREVGHATRGVYIVCFFCNQTYWGGRTHWRSNTYGGGRVGYVYR